VFGGPITLDGRELDDGTMLTFLAGDSVVCGRGEYREGRLLLTPLYGYDAWDNESNRYPRMGENVVVAVDGAPTATELEWTGDCTRVRLRHLRASDGSAQPLLPDEFVLEANYPNPFNPQTTIEFGLPRDAEVRLEVYNLLGQCVTILVDGHLSAGRHRIDWDGTDADGQPVASGVYLYRLTADSFVSTRKMVLLK